MSGARDKCLADARERRKLPALQVQHLTLAPGRTIERGRAESARQVPGGLASCESTGAAPVWKIAGRARAPRAREAGERRPCDALRG